MNTRNVNRQYDDSFANEGAKIGNSLRIRRPVEYTSSTGATIATGTGADSVEQNFTLTVSTQRHIPMRFTSEELTMHLDDFSDRIIEPAMARLAAGIEDDALSMVDEVYNTVDAGTAVSLANVLSVRKKLVDNLANPGPWTFLLNTQANADLVDTLKGLFHDDKEVSKQYREGLMGITGGFEFYENTFLPTFATNVGGTGDADYDATGTTGKTDIDSMTLSVDTGSGVIKAGDVFTIATVNRVHPETKQDTGELQQFVVLSPATATGSTTLTVSPGAVSSGPRKNVTADPADSDDISFVGSGNAATYNQSIAFDKDAFAWATADLVMPRGLDFASRQSYDGVSMRILRDYAIVKDRLYTRADVLYGYTPLYRQLACRLWDR